MTIKKPNTKGRRSKYNAVRTVRDGFTFDSKKEAARYDRNKLLIANGTMIRQLRQVPFHLPGKVIYRLDFMEWYSTGEDGVDEVLFVDVKGRDTAMSIVKRKLVTALYGIEITLV